MIAGSSAMTLISTSSRVVSGSVTASVARRAILAIAEGCLPRASDIVQPIGMRVIPTGDDGTLVQVSNERVHDDDYGTLVVRGQAPQND